MCGRSGTLLQFVPRDRFTLEKGEDHLAVYHFNRHIIHHLFCRTCGIKPFARGTNQEGAEVIAINVRTIDDIDAFAIPVRHYDGKNR